MGIRCESCGKISADEDAVYCEYCGLRYIKTELDALKNIYSLINESQKKSEKISKTQMQISYISVVLSVGAIFIALGALLITALTLPSEQKSVGIVTLFVIIAIFYWFIKKYGASIDFDKVER